MVVAAAGSVLGAILVLGSGLATTEWDAAGLAALGLAFVGVPWIGVWALATNRWALGAVCAAAEGMGFALIAKDGFPTVPAAVASFALGAAAGAKAIRRSRAPT